MPSRSVLTRFLTAGCLSLVAAPDFALATGARPDFWVPGRDLSVESDPEFQYHYTTGAAPWIEAHQHGGITYLLFEFPPRILRYDMAAESWLAPFSFVDTPTAMAVDADGLYLAFGSEVKRYALDGSSVDPLHTASFAVEEILTDGPLLFLSSNDLLESVDKATGSLLDSENYFYSMQGLSIAPSADKIYGRSVGISPSDVFVISYDAGGVLGQQTDSSFHGDYPDAVATWVFPGDQLVADNSGVVYSGSLGYGGSLAGPFDDMAFHSSGPILLRGAELWAYGWDLLEAGRFVPTEAVQSIFVHGDSIFGFFSSVNGADVTIVPRGDLVPLVPGLPVDPTGLAYAPDGVVVDNSGVVYLLSVANLSIFRWSTADQQYLSSIPLAEPPQEMAYSGENNRLYLAYASGKVTQIDVSEPTTLAGLAESPILNSPQQPCGLATVGPWIFLCDPSGPWVSHFTYGPAGQLVSQEAWNYYSLEYVWSEVNERIYFLRDGTSPNDILWEIIDPLTGVIGAKMDSPLHSSTGMVHPIRVHPQGLIVLLGSGRYHNAINLNLLAELGTAFVDAQWYGARLVTLHAAGGSGSELRFWNDFLSVVVDTMPLAGVPVGLFGYPGGLVAVTSVGGVPTFSLYTGAVFADGFESGDTGMWSGTVP